MPLQILAERSPGEARSKALAILSPDNPFDAPAHAEVRAAAGAEPWMLAVSRGEELSAGCYGFPVPRAPCHPDGGPVPAQAAAAGTLLGGARQALPRLEDH